MNAPRRSILLVDDDPAFVSYLERFLKKEGFDVRLASGPAGALNSLRPSPPDAVLLDILLGLDNGWQLLRNIKAITPDVPVILMTGANVDHDRRIDAKLLGAADILQKPFDVQELLRLLKSALD